MSKNRLITAKPDQHDRWKIADDQLLGITHKDCLIPRRSTIEYEGKIYNAQRFFWSISRTPITDTSNERSPKVYSTCRESECCLPEHLAYGKPPEKPKIKKPKRSKHPRKHPPKPKKAKAMIGRPISFTLGRVFEGLLKRRRDFDSPKSTL